MLFLHSALNSLFFAIRRRARWGWKNYVETPAGTLASPTPEQKKRIEALQKKYAVRFESALNEGHALENYHMLDLLDRCAEKNAWKPAPDQRLIDVGSKNFCYVFAQQIFFKPAFLTGIELDAFPLYRNFHTRFSYARHFVSRFQNADYLAQNFLDYSGSADGLLLFYPFVVHEPLVHWFLPLSEFKPQAFFNHAHSRLPQKGWLLMANWDEEEFTAAQTYAQQSGFNLHWRFIHDQPLYFKNTEAVISLWLKK